MFKFKSPLRHTDLEFMGKASSSPADLVPGKGLQVYGWSTKAATAAASLCNPPHLAPATQAADQARAAQSKADPVVGLWLRQGLPPVSTVTLQILTSRCDRRKPAAPATTF